MAPERLRRNDGDVGAGGGRAAGLAESDSVRVSIFGTTIRGGEQEAASSPIGLLLQHFFAEGPPVPALEAGSSCSTLESTYRAFALSAEDEED